MLNNRFRKIATLTILLSITISPMVGIALGDETQNPERYPAIGDKPKEVLDLMGPPIAKENVPGRPNSVAIKYSKKLPDLTLAAQVVYMNDAVVHLTIHRVSIDGAKSLPWTQENLKVLRLSTQPEDAWEHLDTKDKHHVRVGPRIIYSPKEIYVAKQEGKESWIIFHHIPQANIVQIMHTRFYETELNQ